MKYKAKESYAKAKRTFWHIADLGKHERLLAGEEVEITSPPEEFMKHLEPIKEGEKDGGKN